MKRDVEPWLDNGAAEIDALNTLPDAKSSKQVYDALLAEVQGHRSACLQVVHDAPIHIEPDWPAINDWLKASRRPFVVRAAGAGQSEEADGGHRRRCAAQQLAQVKAYDDGAGSPYARE